MSTNQHPIGITDVVLRDAHQSLFATRMRLDDMLPIAGELDDIGFWSLECWGGATFDSCIRFLGEDPWQRLRELKKALPKTPLQMLLRGQNLLGYRHYADDVVDSFVECAAFNGMDIFRVFDALNDVRNMSQAIKAVKRQGKHAQGTLSYTTSPAHTLQTWIDTAQQLSEVGVDSIAIKDMSGILSPAKASELISTLKAQVDVPLHLHCHSTAGLADMTMLKAIEAGVDRIDTAISSMSGTYGHPATESMVAALQDTPYDTGLDIHKLEKIAAYFREIRKKYADFEGQMRGADSRILVAQVPGGMLTNMENQLKQQKSLDKLDQVLEEIPRVREDLGFPPLVTPSSQIVGTQAVFNVMTGERYKTITKETAAVLRGEYGKTPLPVNPQLQAQVTQEKPAITARPADFIEPEMQQLTKDVKAQAQEKGIPLSENPIEDTLIIALFAQVGWKFLANRNNPAAFEPKPQVTNFPTKKAPVTAEKSASKSTASTSDIYTVTVNGQAYVVQVDEGGDIKQLSSTGAAQNISTPSNAPIPIHETAKPATGQVLEAPMSGNIWKIEAKVGQHVERGDVLLILEAMKMETEIKAACSGTVECIDIHEGDAVEAGESLLRIA